MRSARCELLVHKTQGAFRIVHGEVGLGNGKCEYGSVLVSPLPIFRLGCGFARRLACRVGRIVRPRPNSSWAGGGRADTRIHAPVRGRATVSVVYGVQTGHQCVVRGFRGNPAFKNVLGIPILTVGQVNLRFGQRTDLFRKQTVHPIAGEVAVATKHTRASFVGDRLEPMAAGLTIAFLGFGRSIATGPNVSAKDCAAGKKR